MSTQKLDPLTFNIPIVDDGGRPTPEFMRKWSQQRAVNAGIPDVSSAAAVSQLLDLIGAKPGDMLIRGSAQWQAMLLTAIMDLTFGSTRGSVLFRGADAWKSIGPGDTGKVLTTKGVGADPEWDTAAAPGFGFAVGGLMTAGELLGLGTSSTDIVFTNSDPLTVIECLSPPAANADLTFVEVTVLGPAAAPVTVGTIHFDAAAFTATLTWATSPYTLAADKVLQLYAPAIADASLSFIVGAVNGAPAS